MNQLYMDSTDYHNSPPMSFTHVPDLISSYDDISTDPSPSPPLIYSTLNNQYQHYTTTSNYPDFRHAPQPPIINSIEFTDLTKTTPDDSHRRRRRSTTAQDKEAASNMRIRRRAQNRASQRAFRERKEKHVQHLEHELELLETKHQTLEKSYTEVEGAHKSLLREVEDMREELRRLRAGSISREGSVVSGHGSSMSQMCNDFKIEDGQFDPFANDTFFAGKGGGEMGF